MPQTYRFHVGTFTCIAIQDAKMIGTAAQFFGGAPAGEAESLVRARGLDPAAISGSYTPLAIDTGAGWVLIDAGDGERGLPDSGHLLEGLHAENVDPGAISTVILTHLHHDHYGGLTTDSGELVFPNARVVVWGPEWDFWMDESRLAAVAPDRAERLRARLTPLVPVLQRVDGKDPIVRGIRAIPAPGHTPHHIALEVRSGGDLLLVTGDAFLHPVALEKPEWYFSNDALPEESISTRRLLAQRAARDGTLLHAYHFAFPSIGHVRSRDGVWTWSPL